MIFSKMRLDFTGEEEIYQRLMARVTELMASDPELESRDGIELDHLTAAIELYERVKWPMGKLSAVETLDRGSASQ